MAIALLSLFAGLVSMMNALAMMKNKLEIADLSNQEPNRHQPKP
jgi:hypothetical protein